MNGDNFGGNVFINCPYDIEYKFLMDAMIFTVIFLGYEPKLAADSSDSGINRIDKICSLIGSCKFGIHDLSRMELKNSVGKAEELSRFNMPFELGIDYGCRRFSGSDCNNKKFLILEKEKYRYQKVISDLSGIDIKAHGNDTIKIIKCIRDWFVETAKLNSIPVAKKIVDIYFLNFQPYLLEYAIELGADEANYMEELTVVDYIACVNEWKKLKYMK